MAPPVATLFPKALHLLLTGAIQPIDAFTARLFRYSTTPSVTSHVALSDLGTTDLLAETTTLAGVSLTYDSGLQATKLASAAIDFASVGGNPGEWVKWCVVHRAGAAGGVPDPIVLVIDLDPGYPYGVYLDAERLRVSHGDAGWALLG